MYPEELCSPMREDLTSVGFIELRTEQQVIDLLEKSEGTALLMVNSVCGCAAGNARPAAKIASEHPKAPKLVTVFAGFDKAAVDQVRKYMLPYPPSSPCMALFKEGKLIHMIERHNIEGFPATLIADNLKAAFEEYFN